MASDQGGSRPHPVIDDHDSEQPSEATPLLSQDQDVEIQTPNRTRHSSAASLLRSFQSKSLSSPRRWPSIIALVILCHLVILIICFGFIAPSTVEEYANQAVTFDPTALSIDSFTMQGVKARVRGHVTVDASRVSDKSVRRLGRLATWVARKVESGKSEVEVTLPEYNNVVLGTAIIPPIKIDVRNGHSTPVDIVADLRPGQLETIKQLANEWLHGRLEQLEVVGTARVPIKSGIFRFGTHELAQTLVFAAQDVSMPSYDIKKLDVHDLGQTIAADVSLRVLNDYPVEFTLPSMAFVVSVAGCTSDDPHIALANATTASLDITDGPVDLDVVGVVQRLPEELKESCSGGPDSPLDKMVARYINAEAMTLFVQGSDEPLEDTPKWLTDLISDIVVPVPFKGHALGKLIRDFSLSHVDFGLPDPLAEPGSSDGQPTISAIINALINIPSEINFDLDVRRVRADADVFYHDAKLGVLDLSRWQHANSSRVDSAGRDSNGLLIQSEIDKAPLNITDDDVFTDVFQALLFGGEDVILDVKAKVDVEVKTGLGEFVISRVSAAGSIPIKPIGKNATLDQINLKVADLRILDTSEHALTLSALVNFTNPTDYSATIPYFDVMISHNRSHVGTATARNLTVLPGLNQDLPITATWDPTTLGGQPARQVGLDLLSQYISGENTTLTLSTHSQSIPSSPSLGRALSNLTLEIPTPKLWPDHKSDNDGNDNDSDDDQSSGASQFIKSATMHLVTSTAVFTLTNPLNSGIVITYINATALYDSEPVGVISEYDIPFRVPAKDDTVSPRLPVDWSLGSVGYEALKGALGGTLKVACQAQVGVRVGRWEERVRFWGKGIGAKVRL